MISAGLCLGVHPGQREKVSSRRTVADKLPVGAGSGREARLRLQEHREQLSPTGETRGLSTPGW